MRDVLALLIEAGPVKFTRALRIQAIINKAHLNPFVLERVALYGKARKLLRKNGVVERKIDAVIDDAKDEAGHGDLTMRDMRLIMSGAVPLFIIADAFESRLT